MKKHISLLLVTVVLISACSKGGGGSTTTPTPTATSTVIYSLSVTLGTYNNTTAIIGTGFSTTLTDNKVYFNGVPATVVSVNALGTLPTSSTSMVVKVPFNAGTGNITLSVNNGATITGPVFTYQLPITVSVLAGNRGLGAINGAGTAASFRVPMGITTDGSGNVYVADGINGLIRKVTSAGVVSTFAGDVNNTGNFDGTGTAAVFNQPYGITTDAVGNLYVTDIGNNNIRKITSGGVVTTYATGLNKPMAVVVDASGDLFVADSGNHNILEIKPTGATAIFAGTGAAGNVDGTGMAASFNKPAGLAIDAAGNLYVADSQNNNIRKITPARVVTTFAGNGAAGNADGAGTVASFNQPMCIAVDATGNLYVGDSSNSLVRKITSAGIVVTYYNPTHLDLGQGNPGYIEQPYGIVVDAAGNIYIADSALSIILKGKEITTP